MARAIATCTCKTCGATFDKVMFAPNRKSADSKAAWAEGYFDECDDCREARIQRERDAANADAAQESERRALPPLTGTEKQVAWAVTLRVKILDFVGKTAKPDDNPEHQAAFARFMAWLIRTHDRASWWIDNRDMTPRDLDALVRAWAEAEANAPAPESPDEAALRQAAAEELTVAPEHPAHGGAVEITVTATAIAARYDRDADFNALVRGLGYSWDSERRAHCKGIDETTGAAAERAAELGNKLLNAGFAVRIADPEIRTAAINADYQPEHLRWIGVYSGGGPHDGWFRVRLVRGEDMYDKARAIKGAQYVKPNVAVPAQRWAELLDFAEMYDYRLTAAARALADAERASVVTVAPAAPKDAAYNERNPADILASGADPLPELMDD